MENEFEQSKAATEMIKKTLLENAPRMKIYYDPYRLYNNKEHEAINACNPAVWRCIDGRDDEVGYLRYPGASLGMIFTIFPVACFYIKSAIDKVDTEETVRVLLKVYFNLFGPFSMHTDGHAHSNNPEYVCEGCGHIRKNIIQSAMDINISNPSSLLKHNDFTYEFTKVVNTIVLRNLNLKDFSKYKDVLVLKGKHNESAVVVIRGDQEVYLPSTRCTDDANKEYSAFVFHAGAAKKAMLHQLDALLSEFAFINRISDIRVNTFFDIKSSTAKEALNMLEDLMNAQFEDTMRVLSVTHLPVIEIS